MAPKRKSKAVKKRENIRSEVWADLIAIALFATGIFLALCLWLAPTSGEEKLLGKLGLAVYRTLRLLFGQGRALPVAALILLGGSVWLKLTRPGKALYFAYTAVILSGSALWHLWLSSTQVIPYPDTKGTGGGLLGSALVEFSSRLIGRTGGWIFYVALILGSLLIITGKSIRELAGSAGGGMKTIAHSAQSGLSRLSAGGSGRDSTNSLASAGSPGGFDWDSDRGQEASEQRGVINALRLPTDTDLQRDKDPSARKSDAQTPPPDPNRRKTQTRASGAAAGDSREMQAQKEVDRAGQMTDKNRRAYRMPPITLLNPPLKTINPRVNKEITENVRVLEKTLSDFGVNASVTQVNRGPSITRFELQPAPGVKVSRIVSLADDLALALAAAHIRIEAPIPGKAAIGIEVPNAERSLVSLREILEDSAFSKSPSKLTFALGRDIAGKPIVADLARMPHLLIAGSTGSGKSVCINALIASILISTKPDEVKMIMVDPKMVELTVYTDIPHLIHPVVTEPKKAAKALRWAVHEMEKRYDIFAKAGVKDIARYNDWLAVQKNEDKPSPMPQFIILIDELADLMQVASADVEDSICRLAQMARAAGMHLVVATQRPSVDVITGVIKANIPSRIAFAVSSQTDSRVILDMTGAEKLLGSGDMLFSSVQYPKPIRIQGVFVSDGEIENLTNFIKMENALPDEQQEITLVTEDSREESDDELDPLLPEAVRLFIESGQASISLLQRRFPIGYTRAGRIIDQMEKLGIVGGFEGSKPRVIRMTLAQYDERFGKKV